MRGFLEIYGHVDPRSPIGYNISTEVQRLIQSLINTGSFVSAFAIYFLGSRISRRLGLWIGCALAFLSVSIMIGVENLGGLYAGRLLLGMSNGFLMPYNVMFTVGTEAGINAFFGWMVLFFSPYFIDSDKLNWGPTYGYIWGGSNLILAVWTWVFVPETKGRSLEQLDELFEERVGARQFSSLVVERQLVDDIAVWHPVRKEGTARFCRNTASRIGRKKHLH
ncbi:hypothetical protein QBC32DRAFT_381364 [Pseudoneurospora amorphoporcata]|uniref:Major facilitator superfamily (MFS) profile domain-containing protein n=1 Tax=Pseudoneurospora amorphoporcata TaxID=241081 RepID=A0AAN6NNY8_9PEZI|nr:hypothetical protein QBC32DRAFT_381364 [Pseudoneurospora amorphoporcata]